MKKINLFILFLFAFIQFSFAQEWSYFKADSFQLTPLSIKSISSAEFSVIGEIDVFDPSFGISLYHFSFGHFNLILDLDNQIEDFKKIPTLTRINDFNASSFAFDDSNQYYVPFIRNAGLVSCDSTLSTDTHRLSLLSHSINNTDTSANYFPSYNFDGYCERPKLFTGLINKDSILIINTKFEQPTSQGYYGPYKLGWYRKSDGIELSSDTIEISPNTLIRSASGNTNAIQFGDKIILPALTFESDSSTSPISYKLFTSLYTYLPSDHSIKLVTLDFDENKALNNICLKLDESNFLVSRIAPDFSPSDEDRYFITKFNIDFEIVWELELDQPIKAIEVLPNGEIILLNIPKPTTRQFQIFRISKEGKIIASKVYTSPEPKSINPKSFTVLPDNDKIVVVGTASNVTHPDSIKWGNPLTKLFFMKDKLSNLSPVNTQIIEKNQSFKIFPNPVNDILFFEKPKDYNITKVEIRNINGLLLISKNSKLNYLNINELLNGIYSISFFNHSGEIDSKLFIKQ